MSLISTGYSDIYTQIHLSRSRLKFLSKKLPSPDPSCQTSLKYSVILSQFKDNCSSLTVNAVKFREKNFQTGDWSSGTRYYQAIVVLDLGGRRIFSMGEIRQALIEDLYHGGCVGSECNFGVNISRRSERAQQARRWLC